MSEHLPDDLAVAIDAARERLGAFAHLSHVTEVESTNDLALSWAARGAPEGTAVLADWQRAGRGRRGRDWFSPLGAGVYLSVIIRPGREGGPLSLTTLAAGVAAARAVATTAGLQVELKWPNDLVIGRPWRKLAGLLCESSGVGSTVDAVVVGIGINLRAAAYPPELADWATSIESELGRPVERAPLVVECLVEIGAAVDRLRERRHGEILDEWRQLGRAGLSRAPVRWYDQQVERRGTSVNLDADGALLVEGDGRTERLIAGDVIFEGLSRHG
jgi:BirA family transcriptional regulator, biotin operon repressor / biotin---[acetyl-CoA-carboxylase] ligase